MSKLKKKIDSKIVKSVNKNFRSSTKKLNPIRLSDQYFQRGTFLIPNIVLTSIYPFGIIRTKRYFHIKSKIIVFPIYLNGSFNFSFEYPKSIEKSELINSDT